MSSWQAYIDNQIRAHVSCLAAAIVGLADGGIWAKYEHDDKGALNTEELKAIANTMKTNPNAFLETGIRVCGEKYFCLSAENNLVRGRKGTSALCAVTTNSCLILVTTTEGFPPGQLNSVVERLGDYLRGLNY